jgi:hypothetical protein
MMTKILVMLACLAGAATAGPIEDLSAKDRAAQIAAIESIRAAESVDMDALVELVTTTDRADVRLAGLRSIEAR